MFYKKSMGVGFISVLVGATAFANAAHIAKQHVSTHGPLYHLKKHWPDYRPLLKKWRERELKKHPLGMTVGTSLTVPTAEGADWGQGGMYISGISNYPHHSQADGSMGFGIGLGQGHKWLGVQLDVLNDSLGYRTTFFKNGTAGLKLFGWLTPHTSVAIGSANLAGWGVYKNFSKTYYAVLLHQFNWYRPVEVNVGLGTGVFYNTLSFKEKNDTKMRGMASIAYEVTHNASLISSYSRDRLALGTSFRPILKFPFLLTLGAYNLTGPGRVYFGATISIGWSNLLNEL